jgi:hypothetical protein
MQSSAGTLSLTRGQAGAVSFTVTANATYSGSVRFAVSGPLNGLNVQLNPATVTLAPGQSATVTASVSSITVASKGQANTLWTGSAGGLSLACIFGLMLPARRKRFQRNIQLLLIVFASLAGIASLSGCGGSYKAAPAGSSTLVITATPSVSGVSAQAATISVSVN